MFLGAVPVSVLAEENLQTNNDAKLEGLSMNEINILMADELLDKKLWVMHSKINLTLTEEPYEGYKSFYSSEINLDNIIDFNEMNMSMFDQVSAALKMESHQKNVDTGYVRMLGSGSKYMESHSRSNQNDTIQVKDYFFSDKNESVYLFTKRPSSPGRELKTYFYKIDDSNIYAIYEYDAFDEDNNDMVLEHYMPWVDERFNTLKAHLEYDTISTSTEDFYPEVYEPIEYNSIVRERDGITGYKDTFYGEVIQYDENSDGTGFALIRKDSDESQLYYAKFKVLPEKRLIDGDIVDVYGTLDGLKSYTTQLFSKRTVPLIIVDKIIVEGIDY